MNGAVEVNIEDKGKIAREVLFSAPFPPPKYLFKHLIQKDFISLAVGLSHHMPYHLR
jgi:hypothetical protein